MTAEIAILNRTAVALAADSAVSIQHGRGIKIYETHKLFNLSKTHPVGIMVYGNADIMSIPWETIIKHYRQQHGETPQDTLEEYGAKFVTYLNGNTALFPETVQNERALSHVNGYLLLIRKSIDETIESITHKALKVKLSQIRDTVRNKINLWHQHLENRPLLATLPPSFDADVRARFRTEFDKLILGIFQTLPLNATLSKRLRNICVWLLTKDLVGLDSSYSGVVIAGFGEADLYPALVTYKVESLVMNQLRYIHLVDSCDRITATEGEGATLLAFAQKEMVASFMEGIDPIFKASIRTALKKLFAAYPDEVVKRLPRLTPSQKMKLTNDMQKVGDDLADLFYEAIGEHSSTKHIDPVIRAVSVLPKDELASMAEALVNLTSFKRRVTFDAETVGGPIDVAVISKGDGFIWIKRKHYFKAENNPQFFRNNYR